VYPIVPASATARGGSPSSIVRPKSVTSWLANAPAASAPPYTMTSSLAAGSTASIIIKTKIA
jgi:hypothetical protein